MCTILCNRENGERTHTNSLPRITILLYYYHQISIKRNDLSSCLSVYVQVRGFQELCVISFKMKPVNMSRN